jgi:putative DNA primase/helicase
MTERVNGSAHAATTDYALLRGAVDCLYSFGMSREAFFAQAETIAAEHGVDATVVAEVCDEILAWAAEVEQDPERFAQERQWHELRNLQRTDPKAFALKIQAERGAIAKKSAAQRLAASSAAPVEDAATRFAECPHTETGDAEFFAVLYAGRVCFDARRSRWLLIEDASGLWLPDPVERLRGYAVEAMRERQRQANALNDLEKRKAAWKWAIDGEKTARLNNLLREARTQPAIRNDSQIAPWDADPFLLGVPGGVVDLRTGQQRKARPEERITMRAGIDYDPDARSALWEQTLREISDDDPEWASYLQRLGGYSTTGDTSQDRWFIQHGKHGREGKGTKDGAWAGALGDYVLELPSSVCELRPRGNPDFDLSYVPHKRFVLTSETGNTVHLNHDRVKHMTGGGSMRVANKHEKSFEFIPTCKLWLSCNDLPAVTDDSAAFWARVIVIPFRRSFLGKEDTSLRPTLSNDPAHRRAVLAWLVKGAIDYYRDGLGDMPASIREATAAFRDVSWPLTPFVREDCIIAPELRVSVGDFNLAYQRFCERQGVPPEKRLGWKKILRLMEARFETGMLDTMTRDHRRVREKRYLGIGLREPIATSFDERADDSGM